MIRPEVLKHLESSDFSSLGFLLYGPHQHTQVHRDIIWAVSSCFYVIAKLKSVLAVELLFVVSCESCFTGLLVLGDFMADILYFD